jgi:hypothetical protein
MALPLIGELEDQCGAKTRATLSRTALLGLLIQANTLLVTASTIGMRQTRRECPLWIKSRHYGANLRCPLYPQKRTLPGRQLDVRFVPKADIQVLIGYD